MELPGVNVLTMRPERNLTAQRITTEGKKKTTLSLQMQKRNRSLHRIDLKNKTAASDFTAGQIAHTDAQTHTQTLTHSSSDVEWRPGCETGSRGASAASEEGTQTLIDDSVSFSTRG